MGELGRLDGNSYVFEGPSGIPFEKDPAQVTLDAWTYQSSNDMSVRTGINAEMPGFEFLGTANAGIKAEFGLTSGVFLSASGVRVTRVADAAPLRQNLRERGLDGTLAYGSALVLATLTAEKALILTSNSRNVSIEARVKVNVTVAPTVPADLAGNLSVVNGAAAVDMQEYSSDRVVLAMRLLVLVHRGWLWWRHVDVRGLGPVGADQRLALLEALADDGDYMTVFEDR